MPNSKELVNLLLHSEFYMGLSCTAREQLFEMSKRKMHVMEGSILNAGALP